MKHPKECGPTGKLMYSAEEAKKEVENTHRKYTLGQFLCKSCRHFHLKVIKKRRDGRDE